MTQMGDFLALHNQSVNQDFFITRKGAKTQRVVVYFSNKFDIVRVLLGCAIALPNLRI